VPPHRDRGIAHGRVASGGFRPVGIAGCRRALGAAMSPRHSLRRLLPWGLLLAGAGCTLVKPVVGAVTGPVVILGEGGFGTGCHGDGRGMVAVFGAMSALGAVGGLVTGVISDVQVLSGAAEWDPTGNWWHPFKTNTSCR
jgi:hypothetical protein